MAIVDHGRLVDVGSPAQLVSRHCPHILVRLRLRDVGDVAARRVQAGREILAALRHPLIVGLLDAGVTGAGFPSLVMEYVEGAPLTAFCRERALPLDARIDLFRQVCGAAQYAHRHAVVHRDHEAS